MISRYYIILLSLFMCLSLEMLAQNVPVTFSVNMKGLTISPNGVHVAGDFQSLAGYGAIWNPDTCRMTDLDQDSIFDFTVQIPSGTYTYKFINGNTWIGAENAPGQCTVGSTFDRRVTIGSNGLKIPVVKFNECNPVVLFSVNMAGTTVSAQCVRVVGDFQTAAGFPSNWDPASFQLTDLNQDGFFEGELTLPAGEYKYLFINGNSIQDVEVVPNACSVNDSSGIGKRSFKLNEGSTKTLRNCFSSCATCLPLDTANAAKGWWNGDVFYEIFVRSFYDSNNDGIGDFRGIIKKLDYLNDGNPNTDADLGIKGIWLMPMMQSPSYHGYDVTNYYATEPDYGTMADFQELLDSAHKRGIKVIIDLVINHSSSQHPWFTQSVNSQNGYRDWYIWSPRNPGYTGPWGQQVWHQRNGQFYYGLFTSSMPDLNFKHPTVRQEILNISDFWLKKGVDGFRLDAIKYLVENGTQLESTKETFDYLKLFNQSYKTTNPNAFTVGEVWSGTSTVVPYVQPNLLDACFEFELANNLLDGVINENPSRLKAHLNTIKRSYPGISYATFLTNHDINRVHTILGENDDQMKLAASLYLTLPGIPFIYYGEEIGLIGSGVDENKRKPMQWTSGTRAGFSNVNPWQTVGANVQTNNVAAMQADPNSILNHYKKLISIRNQQLALQSGNYQEVVTGSASIMAFARAYKDEMVLVVSNFSSNPILPNLSLDFTNLKAGTYYITDLYEKKVMDSITITDNGGFENWTPSNFTLGGQKTWILSFTTTKTITNLPQEPSTKFKWQLFPNPAKTTLNISFPNGDLTPMPFSILNLQGQTIRIGKLNAERIIDLSNLSEGQYFIQLQTKTGIQTKRFMVEK